MPTSFWWFLIVAIVAFIVVIDDHGEAWDEFKELHGQKKLWKGIKVFAIWGVAIGSFIGTLILGLESWRDDKKSEMRAAQFEEVSNRLVVTETHLHHVESLYNEATNDLVLASNAAADATAKLKQFNSLAPDRTITPEQKAQIINQLRPISASVTNKYIKLDAPEGDFEAIEYAKQIGNVLTESGFNPELVMAVRFDTPSPIGMDFCLGSRNASWVVTNVPSPSRNIIMAFKAAGIKWRNFMNDPNSPEGEMTIFVNHNAPFSR